MFSKQSQKLQFLFPVKTFTKKTVSILYLATKTKLFHTWQGFSFRTKIFILLVSGAALPTILATETIGKMAENQLLKGLQDVLKQDLRNFHRELTRIEEIYRTEAQTLQKVVEVAAIDLNQPQVVTKKQKLLKEIITISSQTEFAPSFYIITNAQGQIVAQNIQVITPNSPNDSKTSTKNNHLPLANMSPKISQSPQVSPPLGINISHLAIVKNALNRQKMLSGSELISRDVIQKLGLISQTEPTPNAPAKSQINYALKQEELGLVIMAVQPIRQNNRVIGLAIVGNLLNHNYQLIDRVTQSSRVSTATISAYDTYISTNILEPHSKSRATGIKVAPEVVEKVLKRGKKFIGKTKVLGQDYQGIYAPIFDHQHQLSHHLSKPVGIYYIGEPQNKIDRILTIMSITSYSIGGGILCLAVIIILPIANTFSARVQRLTNFAQLIGRGELGIRLEENGRKDEIGILERELNKMAHGIAANLEKVQTSELQIREQAQQLKIMLKELQNTQAKIVEQARISSLEQLVAGVAHEINNPVNFIYANVKCAEDYIQDLINLIQLYQHHYPTPIVEIEQLSADIDWEFIASDLPPLLHSMRSGAERIKKIVRLLRIFSRIDEAEYKEVNLHEGIDSILEILNHRLQPNKHHMGIEVIKQYSKLPLITCCAGLLNQALFNIISNAIDAIEESFHFFINNNSLTNKQPSYFIRIRTELTTLNEVKIYITDNGLGISEHIKERIFDPFFTTKPVGKGMGMGLAISYQIITQRHGGTLEFFSHKNQGTEFIITIPVTAKVIAINNLPRLSLSA